MYAPLHTFRNLMIMISLSVIIISLGVYYMLARILTRPLRELRRALKDSDIINTQITIDNSVHDDEIELLNKSFESMRTRLRNSMDDIVKAKTLQLKTHFEVLQAQINPHFLFNMLGIIAISCHESAG